MLTHYVAQILVIFLDMKIICFKITDIYYKNNTTLEFSYWIAIKITYNLVTIFL